MLWKKPILLRLHCLTLYRLLFFLIGAVFLVRISIRMCGLRCGRLAIVGSLLIFLGGFLKAVWKLLFTIGVGDFQLLSESQIPLVAPGFFVLLIVVIMMARSERVEEKRADIMLTIAAWKTPVLIVMALASTGGGAGFIVLYGFSS